MNRFFLLLTCVVLSLTIKAQTPLNLLELQPDTTFDNIHVQPLASDSLVSSFVVWVKKEVRLHHHAFHTETLLILEGTGTLVVGDENVEVGAGDFLAIPKTTPHDLTVTSDTPLKALSIQAPKFQGKDRVFAGQVRKPPGQK
ncbi:MAG: cupin domain-containing protein [Flavobacteriales bacterium]